MGSPGLLFLIGLDHDNLTTNIVILDARDDQAAKLFFCSLVIFIKKIDLIKTRTPSATGTS